VGDLIMTRSSVYALLLSGVALASCGEATEQVGPKAGPTVVEVMTLKGGSAGVRRYSGVVSARFESALGFRAGGKVTQRLVDVGAVVRRGQPIARLDPTDFALGASAAAADVASAEAAAAQTAQDAKRFKQLLAQGHVAQAAYDRVQTSAVAAAERLRSAKSQLAQARNQVGYTTLVADADGVITAVLAEAGQVVSQGQPIVRLAKAGPQEVAIDLPEAEALALKPGTPARVSLWARPDAAGMAATLRELSPQADVASRTFRARFALAQATSPLPLGVTATVEIAQPGPLAVATYTAPLTAIDTRTKQPAVWVFDAKAGRARSVPVQVIRYGSDTAVIAANLPVDAQVVTLGVHKLRADMALTSREARS
jgi:RND family efflux transporter MFP subunit